jgi:hypothetical protein
MRECSPGKLFKDNAEPANKSGRARRLWEPRARPIHGHCPHPSNHSAFGFTICRVATTICPLARYFQR